MAQVRSYDLREPGATGRAMSESDRNSVGAVATVLLGGHAHARESHHLGAMLCAAALACVRLRIGTRAGARPAGFGPRSRARRRQRQAGRRLLRLCQRRLARGHRDPGRARTAGAPATRSMSSPASRSRSCSTTPAPQPPGSPARKVADFRAAYLNEAAIEARGLAPLKPLLDSIDQRLGQGGAHPAAGPRAARRRRPAELGRLRVVQPAGPVGGAEHPRREDLRRVPAAGRARPAGPRALPQRRAAHAGAPRAVSRVHRRSC